MKEAKKAKGPGTIVELMARFPDEAACVAFLRQLRWPDGFGVRAAADARA